MEKQCLKDSLIGVGYAMITEGEDNEVTYSPVKWLLSVVAGGREITVEPKGEAKEIYADGVSVYSAEQNDGYDLKATLLSVCDNIEADWLGNTVTDKGIAEYADAKAKKNFAFIFIEETTDKVGKTTIFPYAHCSARPSDTAKTAEDGKFENQFPQYSLAARPRPSDKCVKYTLKQKTRFTSLPEVPAATTANMETE